MTSLLSEAGLAFVIGLVLLAAVPNPLRASVFKLIRTRAGQSEEAATTPIERELALIAAPKKIIEQSQRQVKDLQGKLVHQRNVLAQRKDDQHHAEEAYFKAVDEKSGDFAVNEFLALVADKEQEVAIEQQVYDSLEQAVSVSCGAIAAASRELRAIQIKVKSDEARSVASQALGNAATIIEAAKAVGGVGSVLAKESRAVDEEFERARASFDLAQGSTVERESRNIKQLEQLDAVRQRLEQRRSARNAQAN